MNRIGLIAILMSVYVVEARHDLFAASPEANEAWLECETTKACVMVETYCAYTAVNKKFKKDFVRWNSRHYAAIGPTRNCIENMETMRLELTAACVDSKCVLVPKHAHPSAQADPAKGRPGGLP